MLLAKTGYAYKRGVEAERIAVNVATLYREFAGDATAPNPAELFALMGQIWKKRRG